VYHRYYDALVLMIPIASALAVVDRPGRYWGSLAILFCTAPFYVNWTFILETWIQSGRIPAIVAHSIWWNFFILPSQTWFLVAMVGVMLWLGWRALSVRLAVCEQHDQLIGSRLSPVTSIASPG
jgi:membrane protein implicated in regulation of membrane protease activity